MAWKQDLSAKSAGYNNIVQICGFVPWLAMGNPRDDLVNTSLASRMA